MVFRVQGSSFDAQETGAGVPVRALTAVDVSEWEYRRQPERGTVVPGTSCC
jgi:hypothetical protein